ncbi:MAG: sporadic carbohydrate cluster protein, LIC12192 family [Gammaproteobacteria bacterium]|jgi:sporadic carbohydrate cluster protein (TIGR04323 family)|nr:sporadic carbohydrate cluster protein, LIC12192 family [Gammaproteobacteria bacterium]
MIKQLGYRGYISSRPVAGGRVPQQVQNLVLRDYCADNNIHLLLSVTEYAVADCYTMLEQVLRDAAKNQGVVLYSLFQLPQSPVARSRIYQIVLENNMELHLAVEGLVIKDQDSAQRVEDIWMVYQTINSSGHTITVNDEAVPAKQAASVGN